MLLNKERHKIHVFLSFLPGYLLPLFFEEDLSDDFEPEVIDFKTGDPDLPEDELLVCGTGPEKDELPECELNVLSLLLFEGDKLL
jgi:hypothetical protein